MKAEAARHIVHGAIILAYAALILNSCVAAWNLYHSRYGWLIVNVVMFVLMTLVISANTSVLKSLPK